MTEAPTTANRILQLDPCDPLVWEETHPGLEWMATLGFPEDGDGVTFYRSYASTCYRRGPHRVRVVIAGGKHHHDWGCFDAADQPLRYYHLALCLEAEMNAIARVLIRDRQDVERTRVAKKLVGS